MISYETARECFAGITDLDDKFINNFVEILLTQSAEVMVDMCYDDGQSLPTPEEIKVHATAFVTDMLKEFSERVEKRIRAQQFTLEIEPNLTYIESDAV